MKNRRSWRVGILAVIGVASLALGACASAGTNNSDGGGSSSTAGEPQRGGIAKVGSLSEMPGFDPVQLVALGIGVERAAHVFDTLLFRDEITDEVSARLAKSMTSEDGIVWVMELREGVEFTDGTPLNADAVIFNTERHIADDSTSAAKPLLSGLDTMEATGEYEVTFTLSSPNGSFPLAFTASSPASLVGSPAALADPDAFSTNPIGAGPFTLKEWVRDDTLTFERNEDYWEDGLPYLDGIEYSILPDNQGRTDTLVSGGVHLTQVLSQNWPQVTGVPGLTMIPAPLGGMVVIPNSTKPPTDDPRVREALLSAFDPQTTIDVVFSGTDALTEENFECLPYAPGAPACVPDARFDFDMEKAAALIDDYVADGGDPTLDIVTGGGTVDQATYMLQQFEAIGVNTTLRVLDIPVVAEARATGDYQVLLDASASAGLPTVWLRYYSGGSNWGRGDYPELDEALLRARDSLEHEESVAAWHDVAKIHHENALLQWFMPYPSAMTYSENLHLGLPDHPYEGSSMVYFTNAWLEQ